MSTTIRIDTPIRRAASPLDAIHMTEYQRRQAEHDLRTAERLVDSIFAAVAGWQAFVRRLRGLRVAFVRRLRGLRVAH